ncbi:hypothetical protein N7539_006547 [Penicillium diatomitis]|uniref:Uncharacterized protein n=1 Tax=Penicillium diatomitis TaxID=2819901 RepID=A0A9X0BT53_9EURO|nr:uncharacterized protein N7539_006547 [Penicillium diatomitis]KAJ5483101.1 hypothetical protein N7539_006547 [Penicillium diatomitis]
MQSVEPDYFTCTLGEAVRGRGRPSSATTSFASIIDVIDQQAERYPDLPAIGFAQPREGQQNGSST